MVQSGVCMAPLRARFHGDCVIALTASFLSAPSLQTGSRTPGSAPRCANHRPRAVCG